MVFILCGDDMAQITKTHSSTKAKTEKDRLLRVLRENRVKFVSRYHIKSLGLFGSYIRNEQKAGSDLDVLVEFEEPPSLFEFVRLQNELHDLIGIKVDLVMKDTLKPAIGKRILREVVVI
jgi:predicted nucleotidyltransferase